MSVSVVMTVFNAEDYLSAAIESVLRQSLGSFEFVIVDDGSTDGSNRIIRDFASDHRNIVLIEQENRGIPAGLNRAIDHARHDLIARIDADDVMMPNRLERQQGFLQQHPDVSVVCSDIRLINKHGAVVGVSTPRFPPPERLSIEPGKFLAFSASSTMMRKNDVLSAGGFRDEFPYAEDQDLWARLIARGCKIAVQPEFFTLHRIHSASVSMRNLAKQHLLCELIYSNLARALSGQKELSLEEFVASKRGQPFIQQMRDKTEFLWQSHYKTSNRAFAERRWQVFFPSLGAAFALRPVRTVRRILRSRWAGRELV
jgi:glycosyltransferase involved in cell wall biosynthesis